MPVFKIRVVCLHHIICISLICWIIRSYSIYDTPYIADIVWLYSVLSYMACMPCTGLTCSCTHIESKMSARRVQNLWNSFGCGVVYYART